MNVTGVNRVLSIITPKYYWPGMYQDVEVYIKGCEKCQRSKPKLKKTPGVLHPIHVEAKVSSYNNDANKNRYFNNLDRCGIK